MSFARIQVSPPRVKAVPGHQKPVGRFFQQGCYGFAQLIHRLTVADHGDGDTAGVGVDSDQAFLHFPAFEDNPSCVFVMAGQHRSGNGMGVQYSSRLGRFNNA